MLKEKCKRRANWTMKLKQVVSPTARILQLRQEKFERGLPFMVNCKMLPTNCAYLEYADGRVEVVKAGTRGSFEVLQTLPKKQASRLILKWYAATKNNNSKGGTA